MNSPANPRQAIGILADDLTSAADGAAPFLRGFGAVRVHRRVPGDQTHAVLSIDTGSRARPEVQAGRLVAQATRALAARGILYKTMDSTLRGHVRTELAAAMRASGRRLLVVAPAFAEAGRVTREGIQYVHGVPVDASPYGADRCIRRAARACST
ncbi:four-carbon acid sugar kinase family protein [Achromobacter xylosoxidans]